MPSWQTTPSPRNIAPTGRLCSRPHGAYRKPSTWAKHPQEVATMAEAPKAARKIAIASGEEKTDAPVEENK